MNKILREIIKIDEEKCDGCGLCVPSCKEGAIKVINGKAKLINESLCDGLGNCLGECPRGAITIEKKYVNRFIEQKPCGCPGSRPIEIKKQHRNETNINQTSELSNWPIQLKLISPNAPYLKNADVVLLADCSAVAYANLHRDFIMGKVVIMACPKLDDLELYGEKLSYIVRSNEIKSLNVVTMEVPCCAGLAGIAMTASAGTETKVINSIVSLEGKLIQ